MDISYRGFEKAQDKLPEGQLDKSVDEVVAEPAAESVPEEAVKVEPEIVEEPKPEVVAEPELVEEEKVPKSRFLTMHQRAVEAEKALRAFEAERANAPEKVAPIADDADLKKFYTETFGDTELANKLYQNELSRLSSIEEKAAERAYERLSNREKENEQLIEQRVQSFDDAFEELAIVEGKTEFTDEEQVAMLDIVENYSPKDSEGNLIADFLLPLDKAYEIYKLNAEPVVQAKKAQRNAVASLSGAKSEGTPTGTSDADWKPGQTGSWIAKLPS
jgi:hypothetical protein